ncbi:PVC-type heme-binding CxxCH protein [Rubritalea tangerina]|uniref:PVC-type heme-binding CxxCH protein n=2 Tax=Rubritalea tangerina TaxID=430798 RepID=A0ABW4Z8Z3_9BACT
MKSLSVILLSTLVVAMPGLQAQAKKTHSQRTRALTPEEQLKTFKLADGFVIELVASERNGVVNPIDLTFDDAGRLWTQTARMYPLDPVVGIKWGQLLKLMNDVETQNNDPRFKKIKDLYQLKSQGKDQILILDDPSKEAKGQLQVWADGLSIPQSIHPYKDGAYVCHGSELFLLRDTDGDGKSDKVEPVLTGFGFTDTHTMAHLLVRGPGGYMYFSQGALNKGEVTAVKSGVKARVDASCQVRFSMDHRELEVVSTGPSNMWGMVLRNDGQWYGTEANDRAYSVVPYEHGTAMTGVAAVKLRAYQPYLPEMHEFRVGGTGISGLAFSDSLSGGFPKEWKDVAILANPITSTLNSVRIKRKADGSVKAEHLEDLLVCEDDWFRPVNIEFGPDGCLYIADWYNKIVSHNEVSTGHPDRDRTHGRIWRVRHESQKVRPIPNVKEASNAALVQHIQASSLWEMRAAWYQIVDRGAKELIPDLMKVVSNRSLNVVTRIHALWALEGLGHYDAPLMAQLVSDKDGNLRREAIRSLASFGLDPSEAAKLLAPHIDDYNCMVRSQVLRTLRDLKGASMQTVELLVSACKPALDGKNMGGGYERSFERFLARYALEGYQDTLVKFMDSEAAAKMPAENLLWAIQALGEKEREAAFLKLWKAVSHKQLDSETYVAVVNMLSNKAVYDVVKGNLTDSSYARAYVQVAVENRSRISSERFKEVITPQVRRHFADEELVDEGLVAVAALNLRGFSRELEGVDVDPSNTERMSLLLAAQATEPRVYRKSFAEIAGDAKQAREVREAAVAAYARADAKVALELVSDLLGDMTPGQVRSLVGRVTQSREGADVMFKLYQKGKLAGEAFDLSAAERVLAVRARDNQRAQLMREVRARIAVEKKQVHAKIQGFMQAAESLDGDAEKGKATFAACLMCHRVGDEGKDIAPPLDGSGHRDVEHLLTAIVDPDVAVEGGYHLYQVTRKDGATVEGFLVKKDAKGTTVAAMGGGKTFVPKDEIKKQRYTGRSFMPASFGNLSDQDMVDLLEYIKTLK